MQYFMESPPKVRIEDVVYDGVNHGAAVGQPLECHDHLRRYESLASRTSGVDRISGKERQVEDYEHCKKYPQHLDGPSAFVKTTPSATTPIFPSQTKDFFNPPGAARMNRTTVGVRRVVKVLQSDVRTSG